MVKIGVGIITCNRPNYLENLVNTLPLKAINELVVINDGKDIDLPSCLKDYPCKYILNSVNLGGGK